jgi:hypothetical protein
MFGARGTSACWSNASMVIEAVLSQYGNVASVKIPFHKLDKGKTGDPTLKSKQLASVTIFATRVIVHIRDMWAAPYSILAVPVYLLRTDDHSVSVLA